MEGEGSWNGSSKDAGTHADRKKAFKKLGGAEEATTRRREHSVQIRKASRDKAISAKRFKRGHEGLQAATDASLECEWTAEQVAQVVNLLQAAQPALRDDALQQLRRMLSSADPPLDLIFQSGAVPLLVVRTAYPALLVALLVLVVVVVVGWCFLLSCEQD
jgi:hypothetical protein